MENFEKAKALFFEGLEHLKNEQFIHAEEKFLSSLELVPGRASTLTNLSAAQVKLKKFDLARASAQSALQIDKSNSSAWLNLGLVEKNKNCLEQAIAYFEKALQLEPANAEAMLNKGACLSEMHRYEDALLQYDKVLNINSQSAEAFFNKAFSLDQLQRDQEAEANYWKAIECKPYMADAHHNLAHFYLSRLQFEKGWGKYEWRFLVRDTQSPKLDTSKPTWDGQPKNNRLFIWAEQGIGDQILYASMFRELEEFPQSIHISIEKKLLPVFRRSFPKFHFIARDENLSEDNYDEQIALGSIGQFFRTSQRDFQRDIKKYLLENSEQPCRITVPTHLTGKLTCGLAWNSLKKIGIHKNISLIKLAESLQLENFNFINLQHGNVSKEIESAEIKTGIGIQTIADLDLYNDIDGLISALHCCDFVVTTSNSVAHLAGAIGKETLLLLPYSIGKFWYWKDVDGKSLWYPSITVFKQRRQGDWSQPLSELKRYLESKV